LKATESNGINRSLFQVNNTALQGAKQEDIRDISRERIERTFATNILAQFSLVQVR